MNTERKEYVFLWQIENYSFCMQKNGEGFNSPEFTADGLEGTIWYLDLYPRGYRDEVRGNISLFLNRSVVDDGPEDFSVKYQLSFLAADGSILTSEESGDIFKNGNGFGDSQFARIEEILVQRNSEYLPQDTLRVRCKIWKGEGNPKLVKQITARTRIGFEQISFLHVTENFTALKPNQKKCVQIGFTPKKGLALLVNLYFTDGSCCEEKIMVEIVPLNVNQTLAKCKLALLDGSENQIPCGEADNRFDVSRKDIKKLPLSITRQVILNKKSTYLPDDKLSLQCQCIFSTGVELEKIERTLYGLPMLALNSTRENIGDKSIHDATENSDSRPSALVELTAVYNNQLFTDMELKTKTKSFPAHKVVLCARSTVFNAMLTNDMKERMTNSIQVDDLENETIQQLLLFLYSDVIENLEWESAIKLYYAGDKYAIERLKTICSSYLVDNLSTSNASELLLLADTHNDSDLKMAIEDFIFKHEEDVFGSEEWRNLIETNSVLVSRTMCLKYRRN